MKDAHSKLFDKEKAVSYRSFLYLVSKADHIVNIHNCRINTLTIN